ncbi:MAG TPA: radical SAM protein, partial [Candidatus Aenigmarchaeota archaeon]|nr:radical SAM protein [Candidatus Aenigmarchaeota archaeon]
MKVVLLNPPFEFKVSRDSRWPEYTKSGTLYYPYWLAYATGVLMEQSNHEPLLIDAIANGWGFETTIKEIEKFDPGLVVIETTTPTVINDMRFAERLKERIKAKICFVGTHVSVLAEETLRRCEAIDFIARREYDYTIRDLADSLEGKLPLKKVLGISFRKGKRLIHNPERPFVRNLDALPFVSKVYKKFLDIRKYRYALARHPMVQIWSSRSCPYQCTFCVYPQTFSGRIYRMRSPQNFVEELEWIKENLPVKEVFIEDDTFTVNKKRVIKICRLIRERKLDIVWSCNARA